MATIGANAVTLEDFRNTIDPNGQHARIIPMLMQRNDILKDAKFLEGNLPTGHEHVIQAGLPSVTWRLLNYGVQPSKGVDKKVTDACGSLEGYSEIDAEIADLNGNTAAFRLGQDKKFLEKMTQQMASAFIYGNSQTDAASIMGLAPRYSSLSAANAENILTAGGSGDDNTSIWLVVWGDQKVFGFYPRGQIAGLTRDDKGQVTLHDTQTPTGNYEGYRTWYKWRIGLAVADWRYAVRICNIDVSELTKDASGSSADLMDLMVQALEIPPDLDGASWYMNKSIRSMLRRQTLRANGNVNVAYREVAGAKQLEFGEVPVRRVDQILLTEATVS